MHIGRPLSFRLVLKKNHSEDLQTLKKLLKCTRVSHFQVSLAIYPPRRPPHTLKLLKSYCYLETHKNCCQVIPVYYFQLSIVICSKSGSIMTHRVPPGLFLETWVQFHKTLAPFNPIFHLAYLQTPCSFIKIILVH